MIKLYETINDARLVTTVEIDGINHTIIFTGGTICPEWRAAIFQSDDEKLQSALEKSSSYGISYRLREITITETKVELINAEEVFNKQSAIEWLRIKFGIRFPITSSAKLLEQAAAEKGYTFLNWIRNE